MKISIGTARKLALQGQGLHEPWLLPRGTGGVARAIERLGYVQIDTIAVIERAHHHTLWVRHHEYTPGMLHELQAIKRQVFEYWAHAACYLPMSDYRYYIPRMQFVSERQTNWFYTDEGRSITDHVLGRIRDEGPLGAVNFKNDGPKRGSWWDWKPAKQALEMLFDMGELMVTERRNFQRIYDLTERVLPPQTDTTPPTEDETARFVIRRMLTAQGFSTADNIRWGWNRPDVNQALCELTESGEVTPIRIQGQKAPFFTLTTAIKNAHKRSKKDKGLHILSPFDSLVSNRQRMEWLFDFDFKLECYFPAGKRKYGYFCLPMLWGDEFIGRMDPKVDRKKEEFIVKTLSFERDGLCYDGLLPQLAERIQAFARFNGCERITIEKTSPAKVKTALTKELKAL